MSSKISELTEKTTCSGSEYLVVASSSTNNKMTITTALTPTVYTYDTSTATSVAIAANSIYKYTPTALTTMTISSVATSDLESLIYFTTGSTFSFTATPLEGKWIGGTPDFSTSTSYVIAIRNGYAVLGEVA